MDMITGEVFKAYRIFGERVLHPVTQTAGSVK
jgi:hypothetical protein